MKAVRLAITGLLLASVLMLAGPPAQQAYAAMLCVDPTGACGCYTTIQAAIDAAQPEDTITVAPGTYRETITIDKSLILLGHPGDTVIDGDIDGDTNPDGDAVTIAANRVIIDGFEIRNGYNGITGETSQSAITNNVIHDNKDNSGSAGVGIMLLGDCDENAIQGNEIFHNDRQGILLGFTDMSQSPKSDGLLCLPDETQIANDNLIANNSIHTNGLYRAVKGTDEAEYGIQLLHADGCIIQDNEIFDHNDTALGQGIYLTSSNGNAIYDNDIAYNSYGVSADFDSADTYLAGNVIHDNTFSGLTIRDWGSKSTLVNFNQFCRNGEFAVEHLAYTTGIPELDATYNWWGSATGPGPVGPGTGDNVTTGVDFWPWDMTPPTDGPCHINSIHTLKYEDIDASGFKTEDEPGLNGWLITLSDAEGEELMSDTTHTIGDQDGLVLFEDLEPGNYIVCETPQEGWINTDPGADPPCEAVTITDYGRGPGSGPLFAFFDHPGDTEFRLSYLGIDMWSLDLENPDAEDLLGRMSEPWYCLLGLLAVPDPCALLQDPGSVEDPGALDPRRLIEWDVSEGFDTDLYYITVENDLFVGPVVLGVKTWRGQGGYSTATGFIECGGPPTVMFGNYEEPTAITLASFTADPAAGGATLGWETAAEIDNAGFNVYRAPAPDGPWAKVNDALIAAKGDSLSGADYTFMDTPGAGTFYYMLEDMDYHGTSTFHGPVQVTLASPFRRPLRRPMLPLF